VLLCYFTIEPFHGIGIGIGIGIAGNNPIIEKGAAVSKNVRIIIENGIFCHLDLQ